MALNTYVELNDFYRLLYIILFDAKLKFAKSNDENPQMTVQMDAAISKVSERLNVTNMADIVNTIIISNHGMTYAAPPMHSRQGGQIY